MTARIHEHTDAERPLADWTRVPDIAPCVPELLRYTTAQFGNHEVLVFDGRRITYAELNRRSAGLACRLLAAGVTKGTRVGMILPNSPEFLVTWFAVTRIGAIAVPLSTFSTAPEIQTMTQHADLALLIALPRFGRIDYVERLEAAFAELATQQAPFRMLDQPFLRDIWLWGHEVPSWATPLDDDDAAVDEDLLAAVEASVHPADQASIIYTSGSTNEPKGVMHTHSSLLRQGMAIAATYPYRSDDRVFTPMPLFWVGGFELTLLNVMFVGAAILGSTDVSPGHLLDLIEEERVTYFMSWPHTARTLIGDPSFARRDLSLLRGGMLYEVVASIERPGVTIWGDALGMTETGGPHTISVFAITPDLESSYGPPMPGMQHRIVDPDSGEDLPDGEIGVLLVRGDALMQGMVKREDRDVFELDGWYRTNDLCSFRGNHLYFHGRADDLIKTAGSNVSPGEVQQVLTRLPGVGQAFVSGLPDPDRGAVVGAVLVPEPGQHVDPEEIRRLAREQLSVYKVPKVILVMQPGELPMMSSGKVDRRWVISRLADAHTTGAV